jgi:hypothetical protein
MSTEKTLTVAPPKSSKCACGQLHDPATDPELFLLTGGVSPALMPPRPNNYDPLEHSLQYTKVDVHACASCWALYAAPQMDRLRREHQQGKKRRRGL